MATEVVDLNGERVPGKPVKSNLDPAQTAVRFKDELTAMGPHSRLQTSVGQVV